MASDFSCFGGTARERGGSKTPPHVRKMCSAGLQAHSAIELQGAAGFQADREALSADCAVIEMAGVNVQLLSAEVCGLKQVE